MVVVVADSVFESRGGSGGLNSSDESLVTQHPEGVVYGLARDRTDLGTHAFVNIVRGAVR